MRECAQCQTPTKNKMFCSYQCSGLAKRGTTLPKEQRDKIASTLSARTGGRHYPVHTCVNCSQTFSRNNYSKYKFCSRTCETQTNRHFKSAAGRKSASVQQRRSKNEKKLFELIQRAIPEAEHNFVISQGWDADIVLPSLKIAILWHGPWHRQEMGFNNHSLKQVQNRDRLKTELFEKLGWSVVVYHDNEHTPETAYAHLLGLVGADGFEPPL